MPLKNYKYQLIEEPVDLQAFYQTNREVPWMAFDTEFVGEKRFITLLCLIQVCTPNGCYLIDPIKLSNLDPFLHLIQDPKIEKITHAGENDYRILFEQFDVLPENLFDTQVAAGFVGYKYPLSFAKLIEVELGIRLSKSYAVTDWESRPFKSKQLNYALNDVIHLEKLRQRLSEKLDQEQRYDWLKEELKTWESELFFDRNPHKEFLANNTIHSLKKREKVFLMRLYQWRLSEAERKDYSKEMVLPSKYISSITRAIHSGLEALKENRRIPSKLVDRFGKQFLQFYEQEPTQEELAVINNISTEGEEDPKFELILEMLHLLIRYKCLEEGISADLVLPRTILKKLKADPSYREPLLESGWRPSFLGPDMIDWILHREQLEIDFADHHIALQMRGKQTVIRD